MSINRILLAFTILEKQLADRTAAGLVTPEAIANLDRKLDLSPREFALFQTKKSLAHAGGRITHEEAQTIYATLGATPADFNSQPIHRKAALTKVFAELIQ